MASESNPVITSPTPQFRISHRPRVLIVDDHQIVREGLAALLSSHPEVEMVGQAADGEEAVAAAQRLGPDVILMDINLPKLNGVEATRRIKAAIPHVRIIGLSMHASGDMASVMRTAGAEAYLAKDASGAEILAAICALPSERSISEAEKKGSHWQRAR